MRFISSLGLFDALANLDFLFPREQGHLAHLVHVHPDRIVQNFQPRVLVLLRLLRRLGRLGRAFGLGLVHDDFHVETPQLGQQRVQVLGTEIVRQNVIDVIVGDVAVLLREMQERPDRLGQIHGRLKGRRSRGVYMAILWCFLRRFFRGNNCAGCVRPGFLRL